MAPERSRPGPKPLVISESDEAVHILQGGEQDEQRREPPELCQDQENQGYEEEEMGQAGQAGQEDEDEDEEEDHSQRSLNPERPTSPSQGQSSNHRVRKRKRKPTKLASARKRSCFRKRRIESTTLVDPTIPLEQPTDADFQGFAALPCRDYFRFKRAPAAVAITEADGHDDDAMDLDQEPLKASEPAIPAHDDDEKEFAEVRLTKARTRCRHDCTHETCKDVIYKVTRFPVREPAHRKNEGQISSSSQDESEPKPKPGPRPKPKRERPNFLSLCTEIREVIYRQLLRSPQSIKVHGNWTLVYKGAKRNRLALDTSILVVNKRIHTEASRILYGENTFLYLLRDSPIGVANVQCLAGDDDTIPPGQEHESDSEYEGEPVRRNTRRRALRRHGNVERDINIDKYSRLFRKIAVEAEYNRYFEDTQESMANAIKMFAYRPPSNRERWTFNIHTLTIRVAPRWQMPETPYDEGSFTFVDLFKPVSRVVNAIKSVECQFLCVDLLTKSLNASTTSCDDKREPCRLSIDMRHLRLTKHLSRLKPMHDWWRRDKMMRRSRKASTGQSLDILDNLASHVERYCHERNFRQRTSDGQLWDSDVEWEEEEEEADEDEW